MVALKEKPEFREGNQKLFDFLDANYVEKEKKEPVVGKAIFEEGKPAVLELTQGNVTVKVEGQICQSAQNQPATEEKVRKQLNKTGATSFYFEQLDIELKGNIFLPVQALNELRREGFEKLTEKYWLSGRERQSLWCRQNRNFLLMYSLLPKTFTALLSLLHLWKKNVSWNQLFPVML